MIKVCTIAALLPDFNGEDVDEAVKVYRAFGTRRGSYAELEAEFGAVAMDVEPLEDEPDSDSDSDGDLVIPAVCIHPSNEPLLLPFLMLRSHARSLVFAGECVVRERLGRGLCVVRERLARGL
jgi:hypothetical protein